MVLDIDQRLHHQVWYASHVEAEPSTTPPSRVPSDCVGTAPQMAPPKLAKPRANNSLIAMTCHTSGVKHYGSCKKSTANTIKHHQTS